MVIDAFSRKVVGWSMGEQMTAELVLGALNMALHTRRPETVIHHSDQGNPRRRHSALSYLSSSTSKGNISSTKTAPKNTGCPPRRSVRRKRRPPPWTTLHLWQPARSPLINRGMLFKQAEPLLDLAV